jgi:hypothetical protein
MIAYPDTSFLCAMFRQQANSIEASNHFAQMPEPLHIASPLLFEFRQATRFPKFKRCDQGIRPHHSPSWVGQISRQFSFWSD